MTSPCSTELLWKLYRIRQTACADNSDPRFSSEFRKLHDQAVRENWGLVQKISRRMTDKCPLPFEDLCQIGYEGLSKAIHRYDPTTGNRFSSLAVIFIRGAILHHLRDHGSIIKIPRRWREDKAKFNRVEQLWHQKMGRSPTLQEIAAELNIPVAQVQQVQEAIANQKPISINEQLDGDEGWDVADTRSQPIPVNPAVNPACIVEKLWVDINLKLAALPTEDRALVERVYLNRENRRQVASRLKLPLNQVENRLQSALDAIAISTPSPPEKHVHSPDVAALIADIKSQIETIAQSGPIAPRGCWIETYKTSKKLANGDRISYTFCRVRAYEPIFQVGDRKVRRIHLAEPGSPMHQNWQERIDRRRQHCILEKQLKAIARAATP